ncbi:MAG: hypothetical protein MI807_14230 [Verrucomicrobiales bacterium]|nr:hypothetical protein [Verrucomicrobiales bacterium]
MKIATSVIAIAAALSLSSCLNSDKRATAGIADEYGMLSIPQPKEKKAKKKGKDRFRLRSIGEMTDPMIPEW